jgi:hypothetical protein
MTVQIVNLTFDRVRYDADGDVLYLHRGDPSDAVDFDASPEGHAPASTATGTSWASRSSTSAGCLTMKARSRSRSLRLSSSTSRPSNCPTPSPSPSRSDSSQRNGQDSRRRLARRSAQPKIAVLVSDGAARWELAPDVDQCRQLHRCIGKSPIGKRAGDCSYFVVGEALTFARDAGCVSVVGER